MCLEHANFENVSVAKKANIYFGGKVTSRTIIFPDGSKRTLGVMLPGQYEFSTGKKEVIEILAGNLNVLLPGETQWLTIDGDGVFMVPAKAKFQLDVAEITDYCCSYVD